MSTAGAALEKAGGKGLRAVDQLLPRRLAATDYICNIIYGFHDLTANHDSNNRIFLTLDLRRQKLVNYLENLLMQGAKRFNAQSVIILFCFSRNII